MALGEDMEDMVVPDRLRQDVHHRAGEEDKGCSLELEARVDGLQSRV